VIAMTEGKQAMNTHALCEAKMGQSSSTALLLSFAMRKTPFEPISSILDHCDTTTRLFEALSRD